jgi:hypothetical protein
MSGVVWGVSGVGQHLVSIWSGDVWTWSAFGLHLVSVWSALGLGLSRVGLFVLHLVRIVSGVFSIISLLLLLTSGNFSTLSLSKGFSLPNQDNVTSTQFFRSNAAALESSRSIILTDRIRTPGSTQSSGGDSHAANGTPDSMVSSIQPPSVVHRRRHSQVVLDEMTVNKLQFSLIGLYGRYREMALLKDCWGRLMSMMEEPQARTCTCTCTCTGGKRKPPRIEILFLSGNSGCGKTALANTLRRPTAQAPRGLFVSGKFDIYLRDEPFAPGVPYYYYKRYHIIIMRVIGIRD